MDSLREIKKVLKKIETRKNRVAKIRDELRVLHSEAGELLESIDDGVENIEVGLRYVESGCDDLSCYM